MTDKTKALLLKQNNPNLRYSLSSSNSSENSEMDYNLYCFSQGYKTHEKGYWRGVLRNKNVDFDLRNNKDWNYPVGLEPDEFAAIMHSINKSEPEIQGSKKFPKELMTFVNDNEIGWESGLFKNFKKHQEKSGVKKQKNKEWILSNGVKRNSGAVELRTQNYKQFEENEKNKELKKAYLLNKIKPKTQEEEKEFIYQTGKQYDHSDKKRASDNLQKTIETANDTFNSLNSYNTLSSSTGNIKEQKGESGIKKRIEMDFIGKKKEKEKELNLNNILNEYNYDQNKRQDLIKKERDNSYDIYKTKPGLKSNIINKMDLYKGTIADQNYRKITPRGPEKDIGYGNELYLIKKDKKESKYGPKGSYAVKKTESYVKKTVGESIPSLIEIGKDTTYGTDSYISQKDKKESKYGPKGSYSVKKSESYVRKSFGESVPSLIGIGKDTTYGTDSYLTHKDKKESKYGPKGTEYIPKSNLESLESILSKKKKKYIIERKPESKSELIYGDKKERKVSFEKDRKTLIDTNGLNVSTITFDKKSRLMTGKDTTTLGKYEPITYGKTLQTEYSYSRTNLKETPKKTPQLSDLLKQPLSQSLQHISTFEKSNIRQSQIQPSTYKEGSKPEQKSQQITFDLTREITFGQSQPQIDYSKSIKTHTDKKIKESPKIDNKYTDKHLSYVSQSYMGDKIKDLKKQQSTYNLKKEKTQSGKKEQTPKPDTQIHSLYSSYVQTQIPKDKTTLSSKEYQTIDTTITSNPSTEKKQSSSIKTQLHTEIKKYPTESYLKKSQTKETLKKDQQFGFTPDYQQYSLASKTQQSGLNKDTHTYSTSGISLSQLNTATNTRKTKHGRLNRSVEGLDDFLLKDKNQFVQINLFDDKDNYIAIHKAISLPKKPIVPAHKRDYQQSTTSQKQKYEYYTKNKENQQSIINKYKSDYPSILAQSYTKTETSYTQKGARPDDKVKTDFSKYIRQTPTQSQKSEKSSIKKDKELEIFEYYPSKTSQKNKLVQLSKQKKYITDNTQTKIGEKEKYKQPKISEEDIYEYNPLKQSNIYEHKPAYSKIGIKKESTHRRGLSESSGADYKKDNILIGRNKFDNILDKHKKINAVLEKLRKDHSESKISTTLQRKTLKTPSSYQKETIKTSDSKEKQILDLNKKNQITSSSDDKKGKRSKSIQNNKYGVVISPSQKGNMAFFKLQFLTTKEVCEKFWKSIDDGELSASMFEFNRNSDTSSKLSNFLSPEKNRESRITMSNDNTDYSRNSIAGKNKYGNKGMNYSISEKYMKNLREMRHSYKSGIN